MNSKTTFAALAALLALTGSLFAGNLYLPNNSFESPAVPPVDPYASPAMASWQKSSQPVWYDPSQNHDTPWSYLMGEFYNVPFPGAYIDNADGTQASFIFALPEAAIFQDYNTFDELSGVPSHAFNAKYNIGHAYNFTLGVIGGGGGMQPGATLTISLYYRGVSNAIVPIASTVITNSTTTFPTNTHFVDFQVHVPSVAATNAWAGQNIGVMIASTVGFDIPGGYWDVDNARLSEVIEVPNFSFESPTVSTDAPYASPAMASWQKSSQPGWYDPSQNHDTPWSYLMGEFYNVPFPGAYIDNADGVQSAFIFALPQAAIFQDLSTFDELSGTPTHAFNVKYTPGKSYNLTVGVIGGGGGMQPGATLALSLYYRDASSNAVTVASTVITNSAALFPTNTHLVDFSVSVPTVRAGDAFAGQNIGIMIASTVGFDIPGGYWDLDNVRLTEIVTPSLKVAASTNGQFNVTLLGEPGARYDIQSVTNLVSGVWPTVTTITNTTGTTIISDSATNTPRRFYRAHQL